MGWDRLKNLRLNPVIVIGHVLGISNPIYIFIFNIDPFGFFWPFWSFRACGIEGQVEQHFTDLLM